MDLIASVVFLSIFSLGLSGLHVEDCVLHSTFTFLMKTSPDLVALMARERLLELLIPVYESFFLLEFIKW